MKIGDIKGESTKLGFGSTGFSVGGVTGDAEPIGSSLTGGFQVKGDLGQGLFKATPMSPHSGTALG